MAGIFGTMKTAWAFARYAGEVREEYAKFCQSTGMPRLDIYGLSKQRGDEHLLDSFCKECLHLRMTARQCAELIGHYGYFDATIPEKHLRGAIDHDQQVSELAAQMWRAKP